MPNIQYIQLNVGSPVLTTGMSFRVRYKKIGTETWFDHLPNPTSNIFTVGVADNGNYIFEIRTVCKNGAISAPQFVESTCNQNQGIPPEINIVWNDTQEADPKLCVTNCSFGIDYYATDSDSDIVLVICQKSMDGVSWGQDQVVVGQNHIVFSNPGGVAYFRFKAVDALNNVGISNVLQISQRETPENTLTINSSLPVNGAGTLDFHFGEPNEVLSLSFSAIFNKVGTVMFNNPVNVPILDNLHTHRNGSVTLDSNGEAHGAYEIWGEDGVTVVVTITGRSSGLPIPDTNHTTFYD